MLIMYTFHSDRLFGLADTGQRGIEWNTTVCREGVTAWATISSLLCAASVLLQAWLV
jgi:hypothetical protein